MMAITEQEFLNAIDIINKYQEQISQTVSEIRQTRMTINEFLVDNPGISRRLINILENNDSLCSYIKLPKVEFTKDLTRKRFLKIRNAGIKSWYEFDNIANPE